MDKEFKTIDELINILKDRSLKIDKPNKLRDYLEKYGYFTVINGYNDLFCKNEDRKTNVYKEEACSSGIIELFELDKKISSIILDGVLDIEKKLDNAISYYLCSVFKEIMPYGQFLKIKDTHWKEIFDFDYLFNIHELSFTIATWIENNKDEKPIPKDVLFSRINKNQIYYVEKIFKKFNDSSSQRFGLTSFYKKISSLNYEENKQHIIEEVLKSLFIKEIYKSTITFLINEKWKDRKYLKIYEEMDEIPLWKMVHSWSFGTTLLVLNSMKLEYLKGIIKNLKLKESIKDRDFRGAIWLIKSIRNSLCHNQVFYNIEYETNKKQINNILSNEYKNSKIRLFEIIKIIEIFSPDSCIKEKVLSLLKSFYFNKSSNITLKIKEMILTKMNIPIEEIQKN